MPVRGPRVCGCGHRIADGARCPCERKRAAEADARRPSARERGYDARWDVERAAFLKACPRCTRCGEPATVVDHVMPHRGDPKLFWNRSNWKGLCATCHSRWKQSTERALRAGRPIKGCDIYGRPLDPNHAWNKASANG